MDPAIGSRPVLSVVHMCWAETVMKTRHWGAPPVNIHYKHGRPFQGVTCPSL
jgi:hypothetical protein